MGGLSPVIPSRSMNRSTPRTHRVNAQTAERWRVEAGYTIDELADHPRLGLTKKTIRRILGGEAVFLKTAKAYARFFGCEVQDLLQTEKRIDTDKPNDQIGDWRIVAPLGPVERAPNELQYRRYELAHALETGRLARGKRFVLDHLSFEDRVDAQEQLLRHTNVCNQVGPHPSIARHYEIKSESGEDLWWVIDEWIEGEVLEQRLASGPLDASLVIPVMRGIAEGLQALHEQGVIMRQLNPAAIILRSESHFPVLVDFEMAKLLGRRPTVSPRDGWPEDHYRAPEVGGDDILSPSADVYSWARVLLHAATGKVPPRPGKDLELLKSLDIHEKLKAMAQQCLELDCQQRPRDMNLVLKVLSRCN